MMDVEARRIVLQRQNRRGNAGAWMPWHKHGLASFAVGDCAAITLVAVVNLGCRTIMVIGDDATWARMVRGLKREARQLKLTLVENGRVGRCIDIQSDEDPNYLRIMHADVWFGKHAVNYSVKEILKFWQDFAHQLRSITANREDAGDDRSIALNSTPAATGINMLWTFLPHGDFYEALADNWERFIMSPPSGTRDYSWCGPDQHRIETYIADAPGYFEYDREDCYLNIARNLTTPSGEFTHRLGGEFIPFQPAWYRIRARVPKGWNHVGLVQATVKGKRTWPRTPGQVFEGWYAEPEAALLMVPEYRAHRRSDALPRVDQDWRPEILEKMELRTGVKTGAGTDKTFKGFYMMARRLIELREAMDHPLAKIATRAIMNATIGQLHARSRELVLSIPEWRERAEAGELGDNAFATRRGDVMVIEGAAGARRSGTVVPQMAAHLWATARARLTRRMLMLPVEAIVGCHGDAIHTTSVMPPYVEDEYDWFRLKSIVGTPSGVLTNAEA